jgi:hypothetical protein
MTRKRHKLRPDRALLRRCRYRGSSVLRANLPYLAHQSGQSQGGRALRRFDLDLAVRSSFQTGVDDRGEGFISLTRAFKQAISGLSDRDTSTYAQVFLCE